MKKVFFIGNSHTYFECLPFLFAAICKQAGIDVHSGMSTYPGCDWNWHLSSSCTLPNLWHGGYDYVVIQQKSHPFDGADSLIEQGTALFHEICKTGAITVLFSTWSEKNNPDGQKVIDDAFHRLHTLCEGSLLAPCGAAWHSLRGVLDLYARDGEHQNSCGAYLNACVLAKTIFGIDPLLLPETVEQGITSRKLTTDEIRLLQNAALNFLTDI